MRSLRSPPGVVAFQHFLIQSGSGASSLHFLFLMVLELPPPSWLLGPGDIVLEFGRIPTLDTQDTDCSGGTLAFATIG